MSKFLTNCLKSIEENSFDLSIIVATVLVFGVIGAINKHWDYFAPVIVAIMGILAHHLITAAIALQRENGAKESITHYGLKLWSFVGIMLAVFAFICVWSIVKVSISEQEEFMLEFHDHLTMGAMTPHIAPINPIRYNFFPWEKRMTQMQIDLEVKNNLQPVTLVGAWGFAYVEPGVSPKSEQDAIKQATNTFKNALFANVYEQSVRMSPEDTTSFTIWSSPTYDELQSVIDRNDVFYVIGLVVFRDVTGTYEQQVCRAITIRDLPGGKTTHYEMRCHDFNDEVSRNPKLKTFR